MGRTKKNPAFMSLLPGEGMHYQYFVNRDKSNVAKRILNCRETNAVLRAFKGKHGFGGPGMRAKFDEEVATLITSGAKLIEVSCSEGREMPEGADFWGQAKRQTLFEGNEDMTVYQFALKLLEARKCSLDKAADVPMRYKEVGLTVKALDSFTAAVEVASILHPMQALNLNAFMDGDRAQDLVLNKDDADDEAEYEYDDDVDELADDLSVQPMDQDSTAGVNLPKSGGLCNVTSMTTAQASGESGESSKAGEAIANIDATKFMEFMNDDEYMDDDDYIDEDIDLSEDEFGMKGKQLLQNIEATDAWYMFLRDNKHMPMEDFVKTPMAKQIMADRAPHLASLLNATVLAKDDYEHDLEKHLLRRADLNPEQWQQREDNREKAWEEFAARRKGKQAERALAAQAALLSVSAYDGQAEEGDECDEYDEYDEGDVDEDGDVEMAD